MRQALEDLIEVVEAAINAGDWKVDGACDPTLALVRAKRALEQPKQEPVAYRSRMRNRDGQVITGWVVHLETTENPDPRVEIEPLFITPPQRKPLTDEQIQKIVLEAHGNQDWTLVFARAIEAAHGIKE